MNEVLLIVTRNYTTETEVYFYGNEALAMMQLKTFYLDEIKRIDAYDFNNSYIDEKHGYAQVTNGLKVIEFRICEMPIAQHV